MADTKQKIIKVGNSLAITLPAAYVKEGKIKAGDIVHIEHNAKYKTMYVKPENASGSSKLTPEFFDWLDNTSKKY
ncbi:MAG: AbrB/MazE/SpoVT family DNA-binding domain-containing protein, partial [bacterium]|nr:AbrB/MazE/SpoVT family DNA-binding domain-containing protein [bacterium]